MMSRPIRSLESMLLSVAATLVLSMLSFGGLLGPGSNARAQSAPIILENLSYPGPVYSLKIPRLEITGSSLSRDELLKLFDGSTTELLSSRLSRLSLTTASAPEVVLESSFGPSKGRTTYKDVRASNVVFGNIGELASSGALVESRSSIAKTGVTEEALINGKLGAAVITGLDLVAITTVFGETAIADNLPMMTLYKSYRVEGMSMGGILPDGKLSMSVGRIEGRDFKARPGRADFLRALQIMQANPDFADISDDDRIIVFRALIQFFDNFDYGVLSLRDLDVAMTIRPASTGDQPVSITDVKYSIGALDIDVPEKVFSFSNVNFDIPKDGIAFRIGTYSLTGFSLAPTLSTLRMMVDNGAVSDEDFQAADPRDFIPILGTFLIKDADIRNSKEPGQSGSVGEYSIAFSNQLKGIPTSIGFAMNHVALDLGDDLKDDKLKELREAGLKRIDFSMSFALKWQEDQKTIDFSSLHVDAADMGSVDFSGTIGNAQQELFTTSLSTAQILALALTAKNAMLDVKDTGGIELFSRIVAKDDKSSPAEVRKNFVEGVKISLKQTFGDAPAIDQVAAAIERFVLGGKRLTIKAKAKNDLGLGFMDFVAAQKPEEVLKKVDIEASAQ